MFRLILLLRAPACWNRVVLARGSRWLLWHPQEVGKKQVFEGASLGFAAEPAPCHGDGVHHGAACAMNTLLGAADQCQGRGSQLVDARVLGI